uniref:Uncharacterized protein n=1 Tax=Cacopsylla melanoneura TaxID=428564 RepID=A0A8D8XD38_9HEMI
MAAIASGTRHQGDVYFGPNRGTQCTVMAASAIIFRLMFGSICSTKDIDRILDNGNEYFAHCKAKRDPARRHYVYLGGDDIHSDAEVVVLKLSIKCCKFNNL